MTTIAQEYNKLVLEIMSGMAVDLAVDPEIDCESHIDEIVFRRSEFLGGMACVILEMVMNDRR